MATSSRPAPKSSLAAARATATPWGLTSPIAAREKDARATAVRPEAARASASGSTRSTEPRARRDAAASPNRASRTSAPKAAIIRSAGERRFMAALLATAVGLTIALAATGARASYARSMARERMDGTLGRASLAQMEFRARNARFALWDELALQGARLPDELRVVGSNASSSHWFLKVQDARTGLTCSRIGQLLDAPDAPVVPECETPKR